jgi:hypothetical protein
VIEQFINIIEILEIEDYKKELGEEWINSIINEWNGTRMKVD